MHTFEHLRRCAALAAGILATGALAAFGSAPALAYTQIYGGGAALQDQLQNGILILKAGITPAPIFTASTSGNGFNEFGNSSGTLGLGKGYDKVADTAGQLDAYVATDSGPNSTELANATTASGASSPNEVTVPVAQTPLDILLSLPAGLTVTGEVDLSSNLLNEIFTEAVPSDGSYSANTWGALLTKAGATFTGSGGNTVLTIELRKNGAGTTLNLKQYLNLIDPTAWSSYTSNANTYPVSTANWPVAFANYLPTAKEGNNTDLEEAEAVSKEAGTVGYATAGDAASAGFTKEPTTGKDDQDILYAQVQDGETTGRSPKPVYADPENNTTSPVTANVYIGNKININDDEPDYVGNWWEPGPSWTGSWSATVASDPDVYDKTGLPYYPIVAVAYDLSWHNFAATKLAAEANYTSDAGATTNAFLEFATNSSTGQSDIQKGGSYYYAQLPEGTIQEDAYKAAEEVG